MKSKILVANVYLNESLISLSTFPYCPPDYHLRQMHFSSSRKNGSSPPMGTLYAPAYQVPVSTPLLDPSAQIPGIPDVTSEHSISSDPSTYLAESAPSCYDSCL